MAKSARFPYDTGITELRFGSSPFTGVEDSSQVVAAGGTLVDMGREAFIQWDQYFPDGSEGLGIQWAPGYNIMKYLYLWDGGGYGPANNTGCKMGMNFVSLSTDPADFGYVSCFWKYAQSGGPQWSSGQGPWNYGALVPEAAGDLGTTKLVTPGRLGRWLQMRVHCKVATTSDGVTSNADGIWHFTCDGEDMINLRHLQNCPDIYVGTPHAHNVPGGGFVDGYLMGADNNGGTTGMNTFIDNFSVSAVGFPNSVTPVPGPTLLHHSTFTEPLGLAYAGEAGFGWDGEGWGNDPMGVMQGTPGNAYVEIITAPASIAQYGGQKVCRFNMGASGSWSQLAWHRGGQQLIVDLGMEFMLYMPSGGEPIDVGPTTVMQPGQGGTKLVRVQAFDYDATTYPNTSKMGASYGTSTGVTADNDGSGWAGAEYKYRPDDTGRWPMGYGAYHPKIQFFGNPAYTGRWIRVGYRFKTATRGPNAIPNGVFELWVDGVKLQGVYDISDAPFDGGTGLEAVYRGFTSGYFFGFANAGVVGNGIGYAPNMVIYTAEHKWFEGGYPG